MTVDTNISKAIYSGNGETTDFAVPFYFLANADGTSQIAVYIGNSDVPLSENVDYTVNGAGEKAGGTVVFKAAPGKDVQIAIVRNVPQTQEVVFIDGHKFPAQQFESTVDKLTMEVQEVKENLSRALILPPTSKETPLEAREELLKARTEAVSSAAKANASAISAASSESNAGEAATTAEQAKQDILENAGFQAVAADLTGPNNIGYVAENYENIASSVNQATSAATSAAASAQAAQEIAQAAQENIVAKTEEFNANAAEKQNLVNAAAASAESSANTAEQAADRAMSAIPSQTGNAGKYLTTDGTATSWGALDLSSKADKSQFQTVSVLPANIDTNVYYFIPEA